MLYAKSLKYTDISKDILNTYEKKKKHNCYEYYTI